MERFIRIVNFNMYLYFWNRRDISCSEIFKQIFQTSECKYLIIQVCLNTLPQSTITNISRLSFFIQQAIVQFRDKYNTRSKASNRRDVHTPESLYSRTFCLRKRDSPAKIHGFCRSPVDFAVDVNAIFKRGKDHLWKFVQPVFDKVLRLPVCRNSTRALSLPPSWIVNQNEVADRICWLRLRDRSSSTVRLNVVFNYVYFVARVNERTGCTS